MVCLSIKQLAMYVLRAYDVIRIDPGMRKGPTFKNGCYYDGNWIGGFAAV